jgi:hypothetical protein
MMCLKKGVLVIIFVILFCTLAFAQEEQEEVEDLDKLFGGAEETGTEDTFGGAEETGTEVEPTETLDDQVEANPYVEKDPETNDYTVAEEANDFQVDSIPETATIHTHDGSFTNYQLQNALFALGTLAQASLLSFENNNYLFFGSVFDDSTFQMVLDEGGEGQITQRNTMGDMGRVYVSMDGGNLTQDDAMVFIPDGDDPSYIYYNTTEVEFEDGAVHYSGESVTNRDDTDEATTVTFDEFGFTSVELHPNNNYTYNDYKFVNNGREMVKACREDSSCDINIEENYVKLNGKVDFYIDNKMVVNSLNSNNEFVLDSRDLSFVNDRGNGGVLAYVYNGNFVIREEGGSFADYSYGNVEWFDSYNGVDFVDGVLIYLDVLMFSYGVNCDNFYCTSLDFASNIITGDVVSKQAVMDMLGF